MQDYKRFDCNDVEVFIPTNRRIKTDENVLLCKKIILGVFLILFAYTASQSFVKNVSIDDFEKSARMVGIAGESLISQIIKELKEEVIIIIVTALIAVALSALTLVLFRYFVGFIVWLMISLVIGIFVLITVGCFIEYANERGNNTPVLPMGASIFTALLIIFVVVMKKNIALAIELFREAAKAVICMSKLLVIPFVISIAVFLVTGIFVVFMIVIESASLSAPKVSSITLWYNILVYCWFVQFLMGCQHMIVAGAVGKWYFTRDKTNLGDPVLGSVRNLWNYHLGTIALGSLVIITIRFVRNLCKTVKQVFKRCCCCCYYCCCCCLTGNSCLDQVFRFMEYLTHTSYIITAIFGLTFIDAGKKAFDLILKHAVKIWTVQMLVKVIMFVGKVFVVGVTIWIFSRLLDVTKNEVQPIVYGLVGLFAYIVVQGFFDTYEIAVDAVIIGFCADCEVNDGLSKPYYMSGDLVAFLEKAKVFDGRADAVPL